MEERKFWFLDSDPEGEIYENLSWDLPGYLLHRKAAQARRSRRANNRKQP